MKFRKLSENCDLFLIVVILGLIGLVCFSNFVNNVEAKRQRAETRAISEKIMSNKIRDCMLSRYGAKHVGFGIFETAQGERVRVTNTEICLEAR